MVAKKVLTDLDFSGSSRIKNLPDPLDPFDAVNKKTLDEQSIPEGGTPRQVLKRINISDYGWADEDNNLDGGYF